MSYRIILSEEARLDTIENFHYYEMQRKGLGEEFLNILENCYSALSNHPYFFGYIDHQKMLRDVKMKRFPFVIIFEISVSDVYVYSIHHTSRSPFSKTK